MTFVKGKSGNPKGRPKKGTALSDLIADVLKGKGEDGKLKRVKLAETLVDMGLAGDLDAIKVILDRIDGKVIERVDMSQSGDMRIRVVYDGDSPASPPTT